MKLAEALSIRKDLEMQISKLKKLLESTVKVQEGKNLWSLTTGIWTG